MGVSNHKPSSCFNLFFWNAYTKRKHNLVYAICAVVLSLLCINNANAAPPPVGTEDYNIMMPYAAWIAQQKTQSGLSCCDIADGRPVDIRSTAHGWEAYISKAKFGVSAPDDWAPIPDSAVLHVYNPTGVPIAWWYMNSIRCFVFGPSG